jgi:hypothetical protein
MYIAFRLWYINRGLQGHIALAYRLGALASPLDYSPLDISPYRVMSEYVQ